MRTDPLDSWSNGATKIAALSVLLLLACFGAACIKEQPYATAVHFAPSADQGALVPASARTELVSWNEGANKRAILKFVAETTDPKSSRFVQPAERIAVFDNDGTLWAEQPVYFQVYFLAHRVQALAPKHPEWKTEQPFRALLEGDHAAMAKLSAKDWLEIAGVTQAKLTPEEYDRAARRWLATAQHPRYQRRFTELVYQPMLELLRYLRSNGFKTFIVTGGEVDFVRAFSSEVYGIAPEQVIGTSFEYDFVDSLEGPKLERLPKPGSANDAQAKPENIQLHIGQRPIVAVGNSDGDQQMLEYTGAGKRPALLLLVHHDDAAREFKYDRDSTVGRLDEALDEALERRWNLISMKNDFCVVFPFEMKPGS
jgi:phosphoglycolate phosphatase-like HAD superfamily hydrolase